MFVYQAGYDLKFPHSFRKKMLQKIYGAAKALHSRGVTLSHEPLADVDETWLGTSGKHGESLLPPRDL